jgi:hypothetical protein
MFESAEYPKPWAVLWVATALATGYLAVALARRFRGWARGASLPPTAGAPPGRVARIWLAETCAQRQLLQLSGLRWCAHLCIFWGFAALTCLSAAHVGLQLLETLSLDGGRAAWFLRGEGRVFAKAWGNGFGLVLLAGLLLALVRRLSRRSAQAGESRESDLPGVLMLLGLTLSGFLLEGLRHAFVSGSPATAAALGPWLGVLWTFHGLGGVALVARFAHGPQVHALLAPIVIALNARSEHARKDLSWPDLRKHRAP